MKISIVKRMQGTRKNKKCSGEVSLIVRSKHPTRGAITRVTTDTSSIVILNKFRSG